MRGTSDSGQAARVTIPSADLNPSTVYYYIFISFFQLSHHTYLSHPSISALQTLKLNTPPRRTRANLIILFTPHCLKVSYQYMYIAPGRLHVARTEGIEFIYIFGTIAQGSIRASQFLLTILL